MSSGFGSKDSFGELGDFDEILSSEEARGTSFMDTDVNALLGLQLGATDEEMEDVGSVGGGETHQIVLVTGTSEHCKGLLQSGIAFCVRPHCKRHTTSAKVEVAEDTAFIRKSPPLHSWNQTAS